MTISRYRLVFGTNYDGWNEESGRASNYLTDASGVLITTPRVGGSAFTQNNATRLFSPRAGLAWDAFRERENLNPRGIRHLLFSDRRLSFLLNSLPPYNGSVSYAGVPLASVLPVTPGVPPAASCGLAFRNPAPSSRLREYSQTPKLQRFRNGISPSSRSLTKTQFFGWPMSARMDTMAC